MHRLWQALLALAIALGGGPPAQAAKKIRKPAKLGTVAVVQGGWVGLFVSARVGGAGRTPGRTTLFKKERALAWDAYDGRRATKSLEGWNPTPILWEAFTKQLPPGTLRLPPENPALAAREYPVVSQHFYANGWYHYKEGEVARDYLSLAREGVDTVLEVSALYVLIKAGPELYQPNLTLVGTVIDLHQRTILLSTRVHLAGDRDSWHTLDGFQEAGGRRVREIFSDDYVEIAGRLRDALGLHKPRRPRAEKGTPSPR